MLTWPIGHAEFVLYFKEFFSQIGRGETWQQCPYQARSAITRITTGKCITLYAPARVPPPPSKYG